ncbi:hypothetical protein [Shewanella fodinae]|uniref:Lipoprotein SmpA/OmlA domain-containing protein n=1 Tax=Shewanella fodinae TaxID=552357 RepID=A0A4R2FK82_9GAMM|nr:hypothetical protein [Shewanella fodinae]TCN87880.1 hypothetical protein EDC91_10411 [Shewanella fodinae]
MKFTWMFAALLTLSACTYTSNMNVGTNFSSEQAAKIIKGKTTEAELVGLLGQPQIKTVINETDVKWVYSYTEGSASAQAFTMKTTSDFTTHILDILLRNGVVLNYAETHTPTNMTISTQSSVQ